VHDPPGDNKGDFAVRDMRFVDVPPRISAYAAGDRHQRSGCDPVVVVGKIRFGDIGDLE
jgi:hypothetical protein